MTYQALGLIETVGLPTAIEAADAAVKSANVSLLGYEKTRGSGLITVKLRGDVGAVKAAVEAGVAAASRVGKVFSSHVIPRPHDETDSLIAYVDRGRCCNGGRSPVPSEPEPGPPSEPGEPTSEVAPQATPVVTAAVVPEELASAAPSPAEGEVATESQPEAVASSGPVAASLEAAAGAPTESAPVEPGSLEAEAVSETTPRHADDVCNLCGDPACPRRKGQRHKFCIHMP